MDIFKEHLRFIEESNFSFYNPEEFEKNFDQPKKQKKILLTIDDGFQSFYNEAWPYLKSNSIYTICIYRTSWKKRIYVMEANKRDRKK